MTKYFLTDIDNVVLDWSGSMIDFLRRNYTHLDLDLTSYSFGLSQKSIDQLWRAFNQSKDGFGNLKPFRDSQSYLSKIAELGYRFIGVTSCLPDDTEVTYNRVIEERMENLNRLFGDIFEYCICIQVHEDKTPYLNKFCPTFWIDDKIKHVEGGVKAGHKSFLMGHEYNVGLQYLNFTRVENWKEVYNSILSE